MPRGASGGGQNPPMWWNPGLYSFIYENLPLEGWVWEFMRRARLYEIPLERSVDAMNHSPELDDIESDYWDYYKPWNHSKWSDKMPVFLPPSAILPGEWSRRFSGQRYRMDDEDLRVMVEFRIDLNRRDKVIERDFKSLLKELREDIPQPKKIMPRITDWLANRILEVWDLRQYNISWFEISRILDLGRHDEDRYGAIQTARNSYNTAALYVEEGGWQELARYIETD